MWVGVDIVGVDTVVGVDIVGRAVQGFRIARDLASIVDGVCTLQSVQHINANLCILHGPGRNVHHRYTRGTRVAQVLVGMFGLWSLSVSDQQEPRVAEVWTGGRAVLVPIRYGINRVSHTSYEVPVLYVYLLHIQMLQRYSSGAEHGVVVVPIIVVASIDTIQRWLQRERTTRWITAEYSQRASAIPESADP